MKASSVLGRVFELLAASKCETQDDWHQHRKEISDALDIANGLAKAPPSLQEFETFIKEGHDLHVYADSIVKSAMFRIMRLCISPQSNESSPRNCQAFVEAMKAEEWYWLVIASLEREPLQERESDERGGDGEVIRQDFVLERMQAKWSDSGLGLVAAAGRLDWARVALGLWQGVRSVWTSAVKYC